MSVSNPRAQDRLRLVDEGHSGRRPDLPGPHSPGGQAMANGGPHLRQVAVQGEREGGREGETGRERRREEEREEMPERRREGRMERTVSESWPARKRRGDESASVACLLVAPTGPGELPRTMKR